LEGYYKISRKLLNSDLWLLEPFTKGQAWLDLIGLASFKKTKIRVKNGETIDIQRGECAWSVIKLAQRWMWSRGKVNRFIEQLKNEKMIQQKICSNLTIIRVLNYNFYQDDTTNSTTNSTTNGTHYKKEKNEKKELISLSINSERIGKREREFLKSYCVRNGVKNANAYMRKVIDNGDWYSLVEEEKQYQCKAKEIEQKQEENKKKIKLLKAERLGVIPPSDYNPAKAQVIFDYVRKNLKGSG
jgi:hypothetical protein